MRHAARGNRLSTKVSIAQPTNFRANRSMTSATIHPAFVRGHIEAVRAPDPVRSGDSELLAQAIGRHGIRMLGLRSLSSSTTATCPDPRPLHEAGNPFPIHAPAGGPQIRRHPGTSVTVPMPLMSRLQFHSKRAFSCLRADGRWAGCCHASYPLRATPNKRQVRPTGYMSGYC